MPTVELVRTSKIPDTFRVAKVQGMFDIPTRPQSEFRRTATLPIDEKPWEIGLITGASGTGKTTLANQLFPPTPSPQWGSEALVDDFPAHMSPKQITELLSAVGLSSSPTWLLPYNVLSTGQQFRANMALLLAENRTLTVIDEFTSTVDRTVAKSASVAIAKHVRRQNKTCQYTPHQLVAVTCHHDVEEWLQPDWVFNTDVFEFRWGSVQPRPTVALEIYEGGKQTWPMFRPHHYLTGSLNTSARVFTAYVTLGDDQPRLCGFFSILPMMGRAGWRRGHRTVILPDFQGLGIGNTMIETVAEQLWEKEHLRFGAVTSAPGIVKHRLRHPEMWRLVSGPSQKPVTGATGQRNKKGGRVVTSAGRLSTSWAYIPTKLR